MLMRSDPFRELDRLTQQLFGTSARPASMPMDAYRQGDRVVVNFDLPGVNSDAIELTVEKNVLSVSVQRESALPEGAEVLASERSQGTFSRQLILGDNLDVDRVEAQYDNGVLTLTVPVAEQAKSRKLQVTSTGTSRDAIDVNSKPESSSSVDDQPSTDA
jgi:HSP20 family protein